MSFDPFGALPIFKGRLLLNFRGGKCPTNATQKISSSISPQTQGRYIAVAFQQKGEALSTWSQKRGPYSTWNLMDIHSKMVVSIE